MSRYSLTPEAEADLEGIFRYTADEWSVAQAERYHGSIVDVIESLIDAPWRGTRVAQRPEPLRKCRAGSHLIFFERRASEVAVIRILHERMDIDAHLG